MHKFFKQSVAAVGLACGLLSQSNAAFVTFDLEGLVCNSCTSVSQTVGSLTLTISRVGGSVFSLADINAFGGVPANYLDSTLSPFDDVNGGAFLFVFSQEILSIGVDVGDFEPSDVDTFTLTAGTGSDSVTTANDANGFGPYSLNVPNVGPSCVRTATASGGSPAFPQSAFWDNIRVETCDATVPEPSSYGLVLAALAGAGLVARRRRSGK